jgi:membrane protein involved in colicin uptake
LWRIGLRIVAYRKDSRCDSRRVSRKVTA